MIRSALRSVSYLVEDVVSVAKWAVGELVSELDYRLQPAHMRQGWAAELADIEAGIDAHEPNAPYLQWGGAGDWPEECSGCHQVRRLDWDSDLCQECLNGPLEGPHYAPYCNRCGYPHPTTQKCLRDATAEDWVRGTAEACGVDPERCVSRLSFEDAESSAVPPTAERPSEVSAAPPSQTPSEGHPIVELIAEVLDEWHPWEQEDGSWQCSVDFFDYDFIDLNAWRSHVALLIAERIEEAALSTPT